MRNNLFKIFIILFCVTFIIYIVKNNKLILEKIKKYKEKNEKIYKAVCVLLILVVFILFVSSFFKTCRKLGNSFNYWVESRKNEEFFNECDQKIEKENAYYLECMDGNYEDKYASPYILEDFKYVEGEWNTGYVVEDKFGNQYVWVPVTNKDVEGAEKLVKKDFKINPSTCKEYCFDDRYVEFMRSVLENGGFFVSRYELGIEDEKPVSKPEKEVLSNLTKKEFLEKIDSIYEVKKNFNCELINGYAYDTMVEWLNLDSNVELSEIDVNSKVLTGRKSNKNIFDVFDNVLEYTCENNYDTAVIRGYIKNKNNSFDESSRYSLVKENNSFSNNTILSARTIIYK